MASLGVGCGTHVQESIARAPEPVAAAFVANPSVPETRSNVFATNGAGVRRVDVELLSEPRD